MPWFDEPGFALLPRLQISHFGIRVLTRWSAGVWRRG